MPPGRSRSPVKADNGILGLLLSTIVAVSLGSMYAQAEITQTISSPGDAVRGKDYYENTCAGCHSIDEDRIGPRHRDVVGRRIASVVGFQYSAALKGLKGSWNEALLDDWLKDPQAVAPGTTMGFSVRDAGDRADVIAYLKTVSRPPPKKPVESRRAKDEAASGKDFGGSKDVQPIQNNKNCRAWFDVVRRGVALRSSRWQD